MSKSLIQIINTVDDPEIDEEIHRKYELLPIRTMRKYLTPLGKDNISSEELNNALLKVENSLKLNSQARQRFRKLLFPLDEELSNMSMEYDFSSPLPRKLKTSTPVSSICTKKSENVNFSNKEKSPREKKSTQNILQRQKTLELRPNKFKNNIKLKKTLTQERISNMFSGNSMNIQTSNTSDAYPTNLKSITCTGLTKK